MRKRRFRGGLVALLVVAVAGCGDDEESGRVPGNKLTIYTSLPSHGISAPVARAVAAGQRLALSDAGGRVGERRVRLVRLDATMPGDEMWDPDQVSANAERAADDPTTIAYLGELAYGGSAVSLPITNREGILQVSPADGLTSLTVRPPGRPRAGPERYYPSERRSLLRLVPKDLTEVDVLIARLRAAGSLRPAIVYDQNIYGRELAGQLGARIRRAWAEVALSEELPADPASARAVARKLADARADAVIYAGVAGPATSPFVAELGRLLPGAPLFATRGILARRTPLAGPPRRVEAVGPPPPAGQLASAGRRLLRRIQRADGVGAHPEALLGYESMRLVLEAIRAGGPSRDRVIREALSVRRLSSPLGELRVRRTGDVDGAGLALYRLKNGLFVFERTLP